MKTPEILIFYKQAVLQHKCFVSVKAAAFRDFHATFTTLRIVFS